MQTRTSTKSVTVHVWIKETGTDQKSENRVREIEWEREIVRETSYIEEQKKKSETWQQYYWKKI